MLRVLVVLLLLANGIFYLWTQGHLGGQLASQQDREPERLQQQVAPQTVRLLDTPRHAERTSEPAPVQAPAAPAPEATDPGTSPARVTPPTASALPAPPTPLPPSTSSTPSAPLAPAVRATSTVAEPVRSCWQASGFSVSQTNALRPALALLGLPDGSWQLKETRLPARWLVYLGRFDNADQMERRRAQLREMKVEHRTVSTPGLSPGLSLGTFSSESAAQQALQTAVRSGIRTARVVQEREESVSFILRLPSALPAQRDAVAAMGSVLAGKTLQSCN